MSSETAAWRTYHISPLRRYFLWSICGAFALGGIVLALSAEPKDRPAGIFVAGLFLIIGLGLHWLASLARIEISEWGFRLRQMGYKVETPWSNVARIRMERGQEAFVTTAPLEGKGAARLAALRNACVSSVPMFDAEARALLAEWRYIPLEGFAWHLRHGTFRDELGRFAPRLLPAVEAGPPVPSPEARRRSRKALAIAGVITVAALVFAFAFPRLAARSVNITYAILFPFIALQSAYGAWTQFRRGSKWMALLCAIFAVIIALWSLAMIGEMIGPPAAKHSKPPAQTPAAKH